MPWRGWPLRQRRRMRCLRSTTIACPAPALRRASRPQGPVDLDNPVVIAPAARPAEPSAAPAPAASAATSAQPSAAASPAAAASARPASGPLRQARAPRKPRGQPARHRPQRQLQPPRRQRAAALPQASAAAAIPEPSASAKPFEWRVHSAREVAAQSAGAWPWLAGLAFLLGAGIMLLVQLALRRRKCQSCGCHRLGSARRASSSACTPRSRSPPRCGQSAQCPSRNPLLRCSIC